MPTYYWATDTSKYVIMPQSTVLRSRYKGHRSSWKVNLEMNQFAYDVYQLYYRTGTDQTTFESQAYNLEFGTTTPGISPATITGTQDIIRRIQHLLWRVKLLEGRGW